MYTWVSSESWLIVSVITLIIFLSVGIDYKQNAFSNRNRIIILLLPVSIFQMIISILEIINIYQYLQNILTTVLIIYGCFFVGYLFYMSAKDIDTRQETMRDIILLALCAIVYVIAEFYE